MGVDPFKYTFYELRQMFISRQYHEWSRFAPIMAMMCAFGGKPVDPSSFNPFHDEFCGTQKVMITPREMFSLLQEWESARRGRNS